MTTSFLSDAFAHHVWATERLIDACTALTPDQLHAPAAGTYVSIIATLTLLTVFWIMRLGNGKLIAPARGPALNPLAFVGRFFAQPRLIAGWVFVILKSCGWWVYIVYLPIFAVEAGLGDKIGNCFCGGVETIGGHEVTPRLPAPERGRPCGTPRPIRRG